MKKFLLIIFIFISFISNVKSKSYYSDYKDYSPWQTSIISPSDTIKVETKRLYKYYNEQIYSNYFLEGQNIDDYNDIDKSDFKTTGISDWSFTIPENRLNRVVENKKVYFYRTVKKIKYIHLSEIIGGSESLKIPEIEVTVNNEKINYSVYCFLCNEGFSNYINNGITYENNSYINNGGYLRLDLNDYYDFDKINLKISIYDTVSERKEFKITFTNSNDKNDAILESIKTLFFTNIPLPGVYSSEHNFLNMGSNLKYNPEQLSETKIEATNTTSVRESTQYRYYDILYKYNKVVKNYSDYQDTMIDYYPYKDESNYLDYYRYCERDKIDIDDTINIYKKDYNLNDYVKSKDELSIKSNIDINKNGTYKVTFKTKNIEVEKEVNVELKENYVKEQELLNSKIKELETKLKNTYTEEDYIKTIDELNKYHMEVDKLNIKSIEYESKIKSLNQENSKIIKEYDNKIFNLKLDNNKLKELELSKQNDNIQVEKDNSNIIQSIFQKPNIYYLIVLILFFIMIISYRFKNKIKECRNCINQK